jgi:hypothetical protein
LAAVCCCAAINFAIGGLMKITLVLLAICALYLFIPRYDLYERDGSWSERYVLRQQGFWLEKNCQQAARQFDDPYRCYPTNTWHSLWGAQTSVKD